MKMSKLTVLLLGLMSATAFAGNYADKGNEASPQNNKAEEEYRFYVDLGVNEYRFEQPNTSMPMSLGYVGNNPSSYPSQQAQGFNDKSWNMEPTITLGYQFLTDNADLQKIFGQQNAIELRASYFHSSDTQNTNYNQPYYVVPWFIDGQSTTFLEDGSWSMSDSNFDFDTTYEDIGVYYTGTKVISNSLINSPYVGIDVNYLKQDSSYSATLHQLDDQQLPDTVGYETLGSDDLSSTYMGVAFGDKATWLFANNYGVYGKVGAGVYLVHTTLSATQTPAVGTVSPELTTEYHVDSSDNQATFKTELEAGVNYYFKNNQDQMSPRVTLLAGLDYWNDVAYADNPTQAGESVKIAYENSINPYAGLQLHVPL